MEHERPQDDPGPRTPATAPAADEMEEALEPVPAGTAAEEPGRETPVSAAPLNLEDVHTSMLSRMSSNDRKYLLALTGLGDILKSGRRLFWVNFLMGLARGVGFVIGMSIIGAVFVSVWYEFLSVSGLGRFIARIITEIHKNAP